MFRNLRGYPLNTYENEPIVQRYILKNDDEMLPLFHQNQETTCYSVINCFILCVIVCRIIIRTHQPALLCAICTQQIRLISIDIKKGRTVRMCALATNHSFFSTFSDWFNHKIAPCLSISCPFLVIVVDSMPYSIQYDMWMNKIQFSDRKIDDTIRCIPLFSVHCFLFCAEKQNENQEKKFLLFFFVPDFGMEWILPNVGI